MNSETLELLSILAQSESTQEAYFPELKYKVLLNLEGEEWITQSARFIVLCLLGKRAKSAELEPGDQGALLSEISCLCCLLREISGLYESLVWHPKKVRLDEAGAVDSSIYK